MPGFSLFDTLIALCLMGLLMTASLPLYQHETTIQNHLEAQNALYQLAFRLENYRLSQGTYLTPEGASPSFEALGLSSISRQAHYRLSFNSEAFQYTLTATGVRTRASDRDCDTMHLNELGEKSPEQCWPEA